MPTAPVARVRAARPPFVLRGKDTVVDVVDTIKADLIRRLKAAQDVIDRKAAEVGTALDQASALELGADGGYRRRFPGATIFYKPPAAPCLVLGAILDKYLALGGDAGFLGYPTTDELTAPDGVGRYNHFEHGSIYWSYASGAHEVHGAIRDRWASIGWELSRMGYPTSSELPAPDGGRVSRFQNGSIYWWPDTGAIDIRQVSLRYKGLYCFGETNEASASDEPYVVFGMSPTFPAASQTTMTSLRYEDVDAGNERPDLMELYRGAPDGVVVGFALCEHDQGDPNKYLAQVKQGVDLVGVGLAKACAYLGGASAAEVCAGVWASMKDVLIQFVNEEIVGSDDDLVAKDTRFFSAKELVQLARTAENRFWGITYDIESPLLSDGHASYKVYFEVVEV